MTLFQAFFLGLVQGLTEFLPVSSTAHLLVTQHLFRLSSGPTMFAFLVLVQWGTLLAVLICFWRTWWELGRSLLRAPFWGAENRLTRFLLLATLPALVVGFLLHDAVTALFSQPLLEATVRLWTAAILMVLAERFGRRERGLESLQAKDALWIGLFQVLSVFPGASRSGSTLSGGMLRGLDRAAAARFAFLLSMPVMLAAGAYELLGLLRHPPSGAFLPALGIGMLTAALSGWLAIRWMLRYLQTHSLWPFVLYCAVGGSLTLALSMLR